MNRKVALQYRIVLAVIIAGALAATPIYAQAAYGGSVCGSRMITGTQWFLGTVAAGSALISPIFGAGFGGALAGLNFGLWYFC